MTCTRLTPAELKTSALLIDRKLPGWIQHGRAYEGGERAGSYLYLRLFGRVFYKQSGNAWISFKRPYSVFRALEQLAPRVNRHLQPGETFTVTKGRDGDTIWNHGRAT